MVASHSDLPRPDRLSTYLSIFAEIGPREALLMAASTDVSAISTSYSVSRAVSSGPFSTRPSDSRWLTYCGTIWGSATFAVRPMSDAFSKVACPCTRGRVQVYTFTNGD